MQLEYVTAIIYNWLLSFYFKELFMLWNIEHQNNYIKVNITSIAENLDEIIEIDIIK